MPEPNPPAPAAAPARPAAPAEAPPPPPIRYADHLDAIAAGRGPADTPDAAALSLATNLVPVRLAESDLQQAAMVPAEQRAGYVRAARGRLAALDLAREALARMIDAAEAVPEAPTQAPRAEG